MDAGVSENGGDVVGDFRRLNELDEVNEEARPEVGIAEHSEQLKNGHDVIQLEGCEVLLEEPDVVEHFLLDSSLVEALFGYLCGVVLKPVVIKGEDVLFERVAASAMQVYEQLLHGGERVGHDLLVKRGDFLVAARGESVHGDEAEAKRGLR